MWTHENSIDVAAPPERLWALFADVAGWTAWNAGIERIELLGRFERGTRFVMQPPGMEPLESVLAEVRPGTSFTDLTEVGDTRVRVFHGLEPLGNGMTRVTYRAEVDGPEAEQIGGMVTADFDDVLAALKRQAEDRESSRQS